MTKGEIAKKYYESVVNCAQAVALSFKEELNMDETTIKKLIIGFGGGFGRQKLVCGAISAMTMVLSYLKSDGIDKLASYALIKEACEKAKEQIGSIICAEIMASKVVPCGKVCEIVADITYSYIK